jgi:uncharacterized protein
MSMESFEWDDGKDLENQLTHGISFQEAQIAFTDRRRIIVKDTLHSRQEER